MSTTSERLSAIASLAEIVSGLAVVVTLVLLIGEVRANTDAVRLTTQETAAQNAVDLFRHVTEDAEIALLARSDDALALSDSVRLQAFTRWALRVSESQFVLHESGRLSEDQRRVLRSRNGFSMGGLRPWVIRELSACPGCYAPEFQSWLAWIFDDPERSSPRP